MSALPKPESELEAGLEFVLKCVGIPYETQYRIPGLGRRFVYDFSFPEHKLVIECQGGIWVNQTGHSSGSGITRDAEKLNAATVAGWKCLQVTAEMIKDGRALSYIERAIASKEQ